jgi:uracil phosphoribosyltransferase
VSLTDRTYQRVVGHDSAVQTTVVDHPLAAERLTALRDERTPRPDFRRALSELSWLLVYEATRTLHAKSFQVQTPLAPAAGVRIDPIPLLVPVLRAGLGMLDAAFTMLPNAEVGFVGLRRDEETLDSEEYMTTVPEDLAGRPVIILDPMLATGGSLVHTTQIIGRSNPGVLIVVCVLAAPEGIEHFSQHCPDASVFTAAVDDHLNDVGFIVPGLGDAGDRQFGVQ